MSIRSREGPGPREEIMTQTFAADGFLSTYPRTSNGASGVILPRLAHLREG